MKNFSAFRIHADKDNYQAGIDTISLPNLLFRFLMG